MSDDLVKLRELAEAATPGPWSERTVVQIRPVWTEVWTTASPPAFIACGIKGIPSPNMAFIAAANPQTVLALLDRIEDLQRLCGRAAEFLDDREVVAAFDAQGDIDGLELVDDLRAASKGMK